MKNLTLDQLIEKAIQTKLPVEISRTEFGACFVEPVSNSKKVRFFRTVGNLTTVFHTA